MNKTEINKQQGINKQEGKRKGKDKRKGLRDTNYCVSNR